METYYALTVYVPTSHLEPVKKALFAAGAGVLGAYSCCCWETKGTGSFLPMEGAQPALGAVGTLERVEEYKLETLCPEACLQEVLQAIQKAHPYEKPAYGAWKLSHPTS